MPLNIPFSVCNIDNMEVLRKDIKRAAEERILELKRVQFTERSDRIKEGLRKEALSEEDILKDFEEKRSSA